MRPVTWRTHILLCVPRGRQVRIQRGIHEVGFRDIEIFLSSERLNRRTLKKGVLIRAYHFPSEVATHMFRSGKQVNKLLAQRPDPIPLSERYREQRLVFRTTPSVPMADISLIINQRRRSPTLPSVITVLDRPQLTVLINIIRKHEDTRLRDVPEVIRGRGWERSDQDRRVWSCDPGRATII